jgi:teichuronic acid biosynthesis glycosyltransferase TuaC
MKILSLSTVYPNPGEPGLGLFVRSRLQALTRYAEVKVIAPIPVLDYSHPQRKVCRPREFPMSRNDGALEIFHPRWIFPPYGTPLNIAFEFARLLPLVARIHKTFRFDLIDVHFAYPEGCTAALLSTVFHVPFTITLRGSETMFDAYRYRRAAMKAALRKARAVITVSDELRTFAISRGANPQTTRTIPNGIDPEVFHLQDPVSMRRLHNLPLGRKLLLTAGELIEAKGHHLLVEALHSVLARGIDAELLIAGATARGGPQFEQTLRQRVRDAGIENRVRFLGWVDRRKLSELLSAADLFCLASYTEGWPNVVNEALACGIPVVVTQVGGVNAMVPSSRYGTIVPQKDSQSLREAIIAGLERLWDRPAISEWGRARSWEAVAREVADTLAQALKPSPDTEKSLSNPVADNIT